MAIIGPVRALPAIVVEHFRAPRNEGPLPTAHLRGEVEGRRVGSRVALALRLDPQGRVEQAAFQVSGDPSCRAGLSLLTCFLSGRHVDELAALREEDVAAAYGLVEEQLPLLLPPLEALRDALHAWRGEPSPYRALGRQVCHCLQVNEGRIVRAIRARRLTTVPEVQFWTRACTGCRSCRLEVEALLERTGSSEDPASR